MDKVDLIDKVRQSLEKIRPHLQTDGGDVEVVDITDDYVVQIKWLGACESCNMSAMTMRAGIQETIMNKIPEIKGVVALNGTQIS